MKSIDTDIRYVYQNIVFTKDGRTQAWYEYDGFHASFEQEPYLFSYFHSLHRLFRSLQREIHCLIVPIRQSLDDVERKYLNITSGNLQEVSCAHTDQVFSYLKDSNELGDEENKDRYFIGVELGKQATENKGDESFAEAAQGVLDSVGGWIGLSAKERKVSEGRIAQAQEREKKVREMLDQSKLGFHPCLAQTMAFLIPWTFNVGIQHKTGEAGWFQDFTPVTNAKNELLGRIPQQDDIVNLFVTGVENPRDRKYLILHQTDDDGRHQDTKVAYMQVKKMPADMFFPQTRWLEVLKNLSYSVGVSVKMTYQSSRKRLTKLRIKKSNLEDQANHLNEYGEKAGSNVYEGIDHAEEVIADEERERSGSYLMSILFAVHAPDDETLHARIEEVSEAFEKIGIKTQNTYGLQLRSMMEALPGSRRYVTEFIQDCDVNVVASSFFGVRRDLGDPYGFYFGRSDDDAPVFQIPAYAASGAGKTSAVAVVFSGETGAGKSMAANQYVYESALFGAKVLVLDPKNERKNLGHWDEKLTELGDELNFITLSNQDEDAGKLDPFVIFDNLQDAQDISRMIISYLVGISFRGNIEESTMLHKAVAAVANKPNPSIRYVKDELWTLAKGEEKQYVTTTAKQAAIQMANIIDAFEGMSLAKLIFGEPTQNHQGLNANRQLNILSVDQLEMPNKDTPPSEYTENHTISIAIMYALAAYMKRFVRMFPDDVTMIAVDEAWNFFSSDMGSQIFNSLFREGRALLAPTLLMTQNLNDLPTDLWPQVGTVFSFRTQSEPEIEAVKKHMNLGTDPNFDTVIQGLENGECFMKDIQKRVGIMSTRILQAHLFNAFDTSRDVTAKNA